MNSIVNIKEESNEVKFPALYKSTCNSFIVLFTNKISGVVVSGFENNFYSLGFFTTGWISCTDKGHWERLSPGSTVELVQE